MKRTQVNTTSPATRHAGADELLKFARASQREFVRHLRRLVECESPSGDKERGDAAAWMVAQWFGELGAEFRLHKQRSFGDIVEVSFTGRSRRPRLLLLGHLDTVYEVGTLDKMPWRERGRSIYGPGVFDMKFGVVQMLFALRALIELEGSLPCPVTVLLNSDEEVGSPVSRTFTEKLALKHDAALVFEPSAGSKGACKTSRKGVGRYLLKVRGKAAHAGLDFVSGASATLELAHQIARIAALTDLKRGVTVNVGVIRGGTVSNVIADSAEADIDVRVTSAAQAQKVERALKALRPVDKRCKLELSGGMNRMPFERSAATVKLYKQAQRVAAELGFELPEVGVGGGSDGNLTANVGVPTLDGLGAVGEGAHSPGERVVKAEIPRRIVFAASLIASLGHN